MLERIGNAHGLFAVQRDCRWGWTGGPGWDRVGPSGVPWGEDLGKGSWEMRGGKAMSLLDESLANSRELARRPVMERGLLSRRDRRKA